MPYISDAAFDAGLNYLKNNVTKLVLLSGDPGTSYANANGASGTGGGLKIAEKTVASTNFVLADGFPTGRKVTLGPQTEVAVTTAGDTTHIAWLDVANSAVLYVSPLATPRTGWQVNDLIDVPAHHAEFPDAVIDTDG